MDKRRNCPLIFSYKIVNEVTMTPTKHNRENDATGNLVCEVFSKRICNAIDCCVSLDSCEYSVRANVSNASLDL